MYGEDNGEETRNDFSFGAQFLVYNTHLGMSSGAQFLVSSDLYRGVYVRRCRKAGRKENLLSATQSTAAGQ